MRYAFLALCLVLSLSASQPVGAGHPRPVASVPSLDVAQAGLEAGGWVDMLQLPAWVASGGPPSLPGPSSLARFEPALLKRLLTASEEPVRGIVIMREQEDVGQMGLDGLDRLSRREVVVQRLQSRAEVLQRGVREALQGAYLERRVAMYKPLWIVNGIVVEGQKEVFWELAARPDVSILLYDHTRYLPDVELPRQLMPQELAQLDGVQWNVRRVLADQVWQGLGITGEGVVVANMDSGVDWQHPDLMARYRGYTGKPFVSHAGNWYCATDEGYVYPGDGLGHGTHTMGIMVGQHGVGVAPGARWIAVKVFNNQGLAYDSWIHDGFQWLLAPNGDPSLAPDVVNHSWGNPIGSDDRFLPDVRTLRAAGILPIFSAGNGGPAYETIASPASFRESFAVGATDDQDQIARFSSRGLSPWGEVKPEVCAPGVGIISTIPGGVLGVGSGTSMAAPHVAGLVALMLQSDPTLTVDQVEAILAGTALPLGEGQPNNEYGWGLARGYAAVTQAGDFGRLVGRVTDAASGVSVADVAVRAVSYSRSMTATAQTGASGAYELGLAAGKYDVTLAAFGYNAHVVYGVEVLTATTSTLDVGLTALPVGVLRGVVHEEGTGAPLQASIDVPGSPAKTTSSTRDGGRYSLTLPEGTHTVRVTCTAHRVATATVAIHGGETTIQDFTLDPAPTILLVDSGAWYNASQRQFYQDALDSLGYLYDLHVVANVDIAPTDVPTVSDLLPYDLVIWSAPQDAPGYIGATAAITNYLAAGGRLFLSGQDVAFWDGGGNGLFHAPYFREYLKVRFVSDNAASRALDGQAIFAGLAITIAGQGGADNQFYPDVIAAVDPDYAASSWMYRADGSGGQTVGPCLPYRAVVLAFGLEGIRDRAARRQVLRQSIDWLIAALEPAGVELKASESPATGASTQIGKPGQWITHAVRLRNTGEVSTDTYSLALDGYVWPTVLEPASSATLGACQSTTLQISVGVPAHVGWHVFDTATLTATSTLAPGLVATATLASKTPAPVLLVDGARFYRLQEHYQRALDEAGIPYDNHRVKGVWPPAVPATDTLAMYPLIVWYTSYDWYRPLDDDEEARLLAYLGQGGRLFFSSQDFMYYKHGRPLARDYLGVLDYTEDLSITVAYGEAKDPIGWGLGPYTLTYPYRNWSDSLLPAPDARVVFRNQHGLPAAISHLGHGWRTVFMAFPFETLDGTLDETLEAGAAAEVMARTVGWLSWLGTSTWQADRRAVAAGSRVTMTCILRNDGWADLASAHWMAALPAGLSLVDGSIRGGATYDPLAQAVRWQGSIPRGAAVTIRFQVVVSAALPDSSPTTVAFPARIGYGDHAISFDLPYMLRVNAPDLSLSTLEVLPSPGRPRGTLDYTLTVRNVGVRDATATVTATLPEHAGFAGSLDSGGIGTGGVVSETLSWTGPVAAGGAVVLRYQLMLDGMGGYWLCHGASIGDQHGERWPLEARTAVEAWNAWLPLVFR